MAICDLPHVENNVYVFVYCIYTTIQKVSYIHQICIYLEETHLKSTIVKFAITVFYFYVF